VATMTKRTVLSFLVFMAVAAPALAQQMVFLVRHAERADTAPKVEPTMAADPDLSEAGRARAASLAVVLKDARVAAIYTTEFKRTQQTAAPLAKALGVEPIVVKSTDEAGLAKAIAGVKGNVVVVGHSNTVPAIIKSLGVTAPITVGDDEFDNLFVLTRGADPTLLRLHYR
jgi:phosphohistidine phosphatase SixA